MTDERMPRRNDVTSPIRWGILGSGAVARLFADGLRELPGAELLAVGSRDEGRARAAADSLGAPRAYGSYEALVCDADVDVVYVATPHVAHRDNALLCLAAGRAVLVEKPFTLDAAQAREVADVARARGLFCMEAMWMRFQPATAALLELLAAGAVGEPRLLTASFGFTAPREPDNRWWNPALGGGALLDLGVYGVSLAHAVLGSPATVTSHAALAPTGVDEQSVVVLGYESGAIATLTTSLRVDLAAEAEVVGTSGRARLAPLYSPRSVIVARTAAGGASGTAARVRRRVEQEARRLLRREPRVFRPRAYRSGYAHEAAEVMRCLRAGLTESPLMPLAESVGVLEVMDTARAQWQPTGTVAH